MSFFLTHRDIKINIPILLLDTMMQIFNRNIIFQYIYKIVEITENHK